MWCCVILLQDELTLLLSSLPVLLYSGQLDIIIGAATTERYLQDIVWEGTGSVQSIGNINMNVCRTVQLY